MFSGKDFKMYFTQDKRLREMEKLMQCVPNFKPRGYGVIAIEALEILPPTFAEVMAATVSAVKCPAFLRRLNQYLKESEMNPMMYKNDKHKAAFEAAVRKESKKNYALLAALYLLTADGGLWSITKRQTASECICFEQIHLKDCTETGYTLFCAAKDLYLGTKHLTVSDLADSAIVPPKIFGLICNAMAIRRFGLGALESMEPGDR